MPPTKSFEWERWLGVRGAAALGGLVLALAGLYLFRFSIEQGWLTPSIRIALGLVAGTGLAVASEWPLRRRHPVLANWLAGAGISILYTSVWAASSLFELLEPIPAFASMVLITLVGGALAVRRKALPIAILALVGGFATPMLISTGSDRPIALFSYLLLLDGAILFLARRRAWPLLGVAAVLGTALYQWLYIGGQMPPEQLPLGVAIVFAFAATFVGISAFSSPQEDDGDRAAWQTTLAIGIAIPFTFGIFFALDANLGESFLPAGGLALSVTVAAVVLRERLNVAYLPYASAAGSFLVLLAFLSRGSLDLAQTLEASAFLVLVAGTLWAQAERKKTSVGDAAPFLGFALLGSSLLTLASASVGDASPVVLGSLALVTLLALRVGFHVSRGAVLAVAPPVFASLYAVLHLAESFRGGESMASWMVGTVLVALLFVVGAHASRKPLFAVGTVLAGATLLVHLACLELTPTLFLSIIPLAAVTAYGVRSKHAGPNLALLLAALIPLILRVSVTPPREPTLALGILLLLSAGLLGLTFYAKVRHHLSAIRAMALSPVLLFPAVYVLWDNAFGDGLIGALPLFLGLLVTVALTAVSRARCDGQASEGDAGRRERDAKRRSAQAWLGAVALGFITLAVPLQLQNEWLTIAWALEGVALLLLYRRVDHAGLKYWAVGLLLAVTVRLVLNPAVFGYHERGPIPGVSWLTYTYLVPIVMTLFGSVILRRIEVERLRPVEQNFWRSFSKTIYPVFANLLVLATIAIGFVWINLTIIDFFAETRSLALPTDRLPARDLSLSCAWGLYAILLLTVGMRVRSVGLRGVSLSLVLVTCAKVFLYDLSHLTDLYRVASLVGLALSLIVVSAAYQRFVFRGRRPA
ncbi:MAG: DUF2339 domain-containing protein [Myxococcota bacterium]